MIINIESILPIILYISLIVLVIVLIVLGIRLIKTLTKVDRVIDDVEKKMTKVNGVFNIIDKTADIASTISDKVIGSISNVIKAIFRKKKGNDFNEEE